MLEGEEFTNKERKALDKLAHRVARQFQPAEQKEQYVSMLGYSESRSRKWEQRRQRRILAEQILAEREKENSS